jgi:condensin-2 complex subunit H2
MVSICHQVPFPSLVIASLCEQSRLEPKLEAEERRRNFDIHVYGDEVMGRVAAASKGPAAPVTFAQAVSGLSAHDICRSFLATLQLANDGNVEISLAGGRHTDP